MGSESFWFAEHVDVLGGYGAQRGHGSSAHSSMPCPMHLFHLALPELFVFIIN